MSDTIFHKIIRKEIPAKLIHEDEFCIAFHDIQPVAPAHILIVPKKTLVSLADVTAEDKQLLGHMLCLASELARKLEIAEDGYRVVMNTGKFGGQTVFQLHIHLMGGREFVWPPG